MNRTISTATATRELICRTRIRSALTRFGQHAHALGGAHGTLLPAAAERTGQPASVASFFQRGEERQEATFPALATAGLVITRDRMGPLNGDTPIEWIIALRKHGSISVSEEERDEFLATLP